VYDLIEKIKNTLKAHPSSVINIGFKNDDIGIHSADILKETIEKYDGYVVWIEKAPLKVKIYLADSFNKILDKSEDYELD
jgi:hypothetical protein